MSNPLISIIVPIYKVEKYLSYCIESIIHQSYRKIEIILVDDGSPDKCGKLCDEFATKDSRITVIHKKNGGLSSARNAGFRRCKGEYVCFIDSDDYISPYYIQTLLDAFDNDSNIGMTGCMISQFEDSAPDNISIIKQDWHIEEAQQIESTFFLENLFKNRFAHYAWNKMYRYSLIKDVPFQEGKNNEDTLFMYDLSKKIEKENNIFKLIPQYLYYYRLREGSICRDNTKPFIVDKIVNYRDIAIDLENREKTIFKTLKLYWQKECVLFLFSCLKNRYYHKNYYHWMRKAYLYEIDEVFLIKNNIEEETINKLRFLKKNLIGRNLLYLKSCVYLFLHDIGLK